MSRIAGPRLPYVAVQRRDGRSRRACPGVAARRAGCGGRYIAASSSSPVPVIVSGSCRVRDAGRGRCTTSARCRDRRTSAPTPTIPGGARGRGGRHALASRGRSWMSGHASWRRGRARDWRRNFRPFNEVRSAGRGSKYRNDLIGSQPNHFIDGQQQVARLELRDKERGNWVRLPIIGPAASLGTRRRRAKIGIANQHLDVLRLTSPDLWRNLRYTSTTNRLV
jgi:hypothetical protein